MSKTQVRPTSKGQVTLPISIRKQLNVGPETYLDVSVKSGSIILKPMQLKSREESRIYSSDEIDEFLKEDQISEENAKYFKKLLKLEK